MKSKLTRVIVIMMAVCFLLTACNNANNKSKQEDQTKTESNGSAEVGKKESDGNFNATGLPVFKEPVTYTIIARTPPLAKKSYSEKEVYQKRSEETNVIIDWQEVPAAGFGEKVNILLNAGELPDGLYPGWINTALNISAIESKIIVPISDYSEYTPNLNKALEVYSDVVPKLVFQDDGKLYAYPKFTPSVGSEYRAPLFINKQWLDNLGLDIPKTTDDFYKVLKAFKEGDPNGNGDTTDELPASFDVPGFGLSIEELFAAWGIQPPLNNCMSCGVTDGKVHFSPIEEGYRQALEYFHKLYSEGLLDPESLTQKTAAHNAKIERDVPIVGAYTTWVYQQNNREQYIALEPLTGPNGDQFVGRWPKEDNISADGFVIFSNCKQPEGLIRWIDWCMDGTNAIEIQYGPEGVAWERNEQDKTWKLLPDNLAKLGVSFEEYKQTEGTQNGMLLHMIDEVTGYKYVPATNSDDALKEEWTKMAAPYFFPDNLCRTVIKRSSTPEDEEITFVWNDLGEYLKIFIVNSIINGVDDAVWAEHLSECETLKYENVIEYQQQKYDILNK